jgi:hypothetical protein
VLTNTAPSRLYKTVSATTPIINPAPPISFTYQPIPMGSVWTGTIQVLQAPAWAFHQCTIGGVIWAEWLGFQPSPVVQAMTGEVITVTSTGLSPNTLYQATLIGRSDTQDTYIPVWPEASQNTNLGSSAIAEQTVPQNTGPGFTAVIQSGLPGQVLAIQFASAGGTCLGLRISCTNGTGNRITTLYPQNNALLQPWWFVPIQDSSTTITIDPINAAKAVGGTFQGILRTAVIPGPLFVPVLQSGWDLGISGPSNIGLQANISVGSTLTSTIIPEPPTGAMNYIRALSITNAAGPGAANVCSLQGSFSGGVYRRYAAPVATLSIEDPSQYYVGDAVRADPAEGLTFTNGFNVSVVVSMTYDLVPFPQGFGQGMN